MLLKRGVGRPTSGKVYVSYNRRMELWMDADIREVVRLMPEKYRSVTAFVDAAIVAQLVDDKVELFKQGKRDSPD
jgi:hypothetical protein